MSDPQAAPSDGAEIDATGVDADFVTNDTDPEPDSATPGDQQTVTGDDAADDNAADDDDEVAVSDLP
nr:hypothetical protein [uncultured Microbacterium sp.]